MKKRLFDLSALIIVVSILLAGCGKSDSAYEQSYATGAAYDMGYSEPMMAKEAPAEYMTDNLYDVAEEEAIYEENGSVDGSNGAEILNETDNGTDRKLIKTVNLNVETEEFDKLMSNIEGKAAALGGYIESSDISGRSLYNTTSNRYASITVRIPNKNLDSFISDIASQSNITNKSLGTEDVTLQYADTQAHIESLKSEQTRLNELIAQAEDVDTIIILEERLTEVRYEIESYERQIRLLDNKVDYSTIYLYIDEVLHYTPTEPVDKTVGERISEGLADTFYSIGEGFKEFFIGFVIVLPYLFIVAIIIAIIAFIVVLIIKGEKKKRAKRLLKKQEKIKKNYKASLDKKTEADDSVKSATDQNDIQ